MPAEVSSYLRFKYAKGLVSVILLEVICITEKTVASLNQVGQLVNGTTILAS
jgi:hypothetical protein